jgi:hypothetical protein
MHHAEMNYLIWQNGAQIGPFDDAQVRQMLADGRIKGDDLAWRDGLAEWAPIATLLAAAQAAPPPPQPSAPPAVYGAGGARPHSSPMGTMTKMLIGLGALGFIIIVGLIGFGVTQVLKISSSAQDYVNDYVAHIAPDWSSDVLLKRVTPKYSDKFDPKMMQAMFKKLSALGKLKHADPSTATANVRSSSVGDNVVANVVDHATFDGGEATFTIYLVQVDGQWTIAGFHVESPIFFK